MFNVGDRVKVTGYENYNGETGVISELFNKTVDRYDCAVTFDSNKLGMAFNFNELELLPHDIQVRIKRLSPDSVVPTYATGGSACFDLVASEDVLICPGETKAIPTGLSFEIPEGYKMCIYPRSGISLKTSLRVANAPGCVDSDYRGEVKVLLWNTERYQGCTDTLLYIDGTRKSTDSYDHCIGTYLIRKGDRIAQAEIVPVLRASFTEVDQLSTTERGDGAFGSTGVR